MAATALLPVVLMPWLGVLGSREICVNYLKVIRLLSDEIYYCCKLLYSAFVNINRCKVGNRLLCQKSSGLLFPFGFVSIIMSTSVHQ